MITIKDIAHEAGVSTMTVSRVINKKYNQVSQANIDLIEGLIRKYNYVPNSSARSLSSKASKIITVFLPTSDNPLADPYNACILGYFIQDIEARGYDAIVVFTRDYSDIEDSLRTWSASGAILPGLYPEEYDRLAQNIHVPIALTDTYPLNQHFINVRINDYQGGVLAAEHFIEMGHQHFAFCSQYMHSSMVVEERLRGFKETILSHGLSFTDECIVDVEDAEENLKCLSALKKDHLAVFISSDVFAATMVNLMHTRGYSVPEDFSVIGFDNLPQTGTLYPPLTTIDQHLKEKAAFIVDSLFNAIQYPELPLAEKVFDVELIKRDSVLDLRKQSSDWH